MTVNLKMPDIQELKPRITVFGIGGAGGNAVNNMISSGLVGCDFVVTNTDAQVLANSKAECVVQMGVSVTEGLGAGSQPEVGAAAAEEVLDEINGYLNGAHMVFITAGMGGGTGTGGAPVIARAAREQGILTVGVVTKPFHFEGARRMRAAEEGIVALQKEVDTLIVIPNQNLFRIADAQTTFAEAFGMADQVLYSGVACITDLMVKEGMINLDFADVRSIMRDMGKAMMGTGQASGDSRALEAAEKAIANPLLDETSMQGARGLLISITGARDDLKLVEVDEATNRIREEVDPDANVVLGAIFDDELSGSIRVSVVATGIDNESRAQYAPVGGNDFVEADWTGEGATIVPLQSGVQGSGASSARTAPVSHTARHYGSIPGGDGGALAREAHVDMPDLGDVGDIDGAALRQTEPVAEASPARPYVPPQAEPVNGDHMPRTTPFALAAKAVDPAQSSGHGSDDQKPRGLLKRLADNFHQRPEEPMRERRPAARPHAPGPADARQYRAQHPAAGAGRMAARHTNSASAHAALHHVPPQANAAEAPLAGHPVNALPAGGAGDAGDAVDAGAVGVAPPAGAHMAVRQAATGQAGSETANAAPRAAQMVPGPHQMAQSFGQAARTPARSIASDEDQLEIPAFLRRSSH